MKNLLLNPLIFPLASDKEIALFETAMLINKTYNDWQVKTLHKKGDYLILSCYNYSECLSEFDTPAKTDIDQGMFVIYSTLRRQIVEIMLIGDSKGMSEVNTAEIDLIGRVNRLMKEHLSVLGR